MHRRKFSFRPRDIPCPHAADGCTVMFSDRSGIKRHCNSIHRHLRRRQKTPSPAPAAAQPPQFPDDDFFDGHQEHVPGSPYPGQQEESGEGDEDDEEHANANQHHPRVPDYHQFLDARHCDEHGNFLADDAPPQARPRRAPGDYSPFESRLQFEVGDFLYRRVQMSGTRIDELMQLWACSLDEGQEPPFAGRVHMYDTFDGIPVGEAPWDHFSISFNGTPPPGPLPSWMIREYEVFFRDPRKVLHNQIGNPDFKDDFDYVPKRMYNDTGKRKYKDFMSGEWVWAQADELSLNPRLHGAAFCPAILGSDKTTVSVATGQNEYYPLYMSNGWVTNSTRRAHRNAITLIGFLAIPKTDRQYKDDPTFRKFRRELFHTSLRHIFESLRAYMNDYDVVLCADGYYRRVVYGFGPYIADYPEQVLLACTVQGWCPKCMAPPDDLDSGHHARRSHELTAAYIDTGLSTRRLWEDYGIVSYLTPFTAYFPRADIHELISPDLLHQIIKGTFKDHLVTWVEEYLVITHGKAGLRRFPEGRGFKQWTGDDSKALMKVYLPAISGHVPAQMVRAISAFLDFCYLVRRDTIDEDTIDQIEDALRRFHTERTIFETTGVRISISLPRQHAMKHYIRMIRQFGSPNGLCSSMMEAKHIIAVKRPYRRSNKNNALGQIIKTNERLDKLAAFRVELTACGLLDGPCPRLPAFIRDAQDPERGLDESDSDSDAEQRAGLAHQVTPAQNPPAPNDTQDDPDAPPELEEEDADTAVVNDVEVLADVFLARTPVRRLPKQLEDVAAYLGYPTLPSLIRFFLYDQLSPDANMTGEDAGLAACPVFSGRIKVFPSATAIFHAPSDPSGIRGMRQERIRATRIWHGGRARRDCVYVMKDANLPGFRGLHVARVHVFFSFVFQARLYECALVSWYTPVGDEPDPDTGMSSA
ncbi:hypothetical protein BN946_scf184573.g13 [Trametes cinnabarina]|uniref:C2H2-type domain-containing protein n=1 Tax=Pycnoporus cinnabarinus TaxID=5643 RepID=A0A060S860_PYCCI|nr:hypothetical protein BN946_scf184573.g13 [Trametes cinnabarina]